jgi:hypothetical protein
MYSRQRSSLRRYKFIERGWREIEVNDTAVARDQRIENLLSDKPPIDYISELPKGAYGGSYTNSDLLGDDLFPF